MSDAVDFAAIADEAIARMDTPAAAVNEPEAPAPEPVVETLAPEQETPDVAAPEATPEAADVFDDEAVQSFDRDYVRKLRDENAEHRTKLREEQERWGEWNTTLEGLDADTQGLARELVASILQGDLARAVEIIGKDELAQVLGAAGLPPGVDAPNADAPLTRAEVDKMLAEREATQAREAEVARVQTQAKDLGYDPTAKPGTPEFGRWIMVVQYAQAHGGLEAGHKALQAVEAAERQRYIDEFVASRSNGSPAPAASSGAASREPDDAWLEKGSNPLNAAASRAMQRFAGDRSQVG